MPGVRSARGRFGPRGVLPRRATRKRAATRSRPPALKLSVAALWPAPDAVAEASVSVAMPLPAKCFVDDNKQVVLPHVVEVRVLDRVAYTAGVAVADRPGPPDGALHQAGQTQQG